MRLMWLAVIGLFLVSFRPPDFTARGCRFVYMGGGWYPLPVQVLSLKGYAVALESGMTLRAHLNMETGKVYLSCHIDDGGNTE